MARWPGISQFDLTDQVAIVTGGSKGLGEVMAAGLASLQQIQQPGLYEQLSATTERLALGFKAIADEFGVPMSVNFAGSMFGLFFTDVPRVTNYQQAINCNIEQFNRFYHGMLEAGVYLAPASYEAGFVSAAHDDSVIEETLNIARKVISSL